ncbi:hypothetical protein GCM10022282_03510 [Agromyces indicus]
MVMFAIIVFTSTCRKRRMPFAGGSTPVDEGAGPGSVIPSAMVASVGRTTDIR